MWIDPLGHAIEVDDHWSFVAQERFGEDSYESFIDSHTPRNVPEKENWDAVDEANTELAAEADAMIHEGWIRVVGQGGGLGGFSNSIGIQGMLDPMIRNQGVLNEISYTTDADELIVEVVRPGEKPPRTFYIPAGAPVISTLMRQRIAEGVSLDELRRRPIHVRSHRRSR
jgi:hypothetical protein